MFKRIRFIEIDSINEYYGKKYEFLIHFYEKDYCPWENIHQIQFVFGLLIQKLLKFIFGIFTLILNVI